LTSLLSRDNLSSLYLNRIIRTIEAKGKKPFYLAKKKKGTVRHEYRLKFPGLTRMVEKSLKGV